MVVHVPVMKNWKNFSADFLGKKSVRFSALGTLSGMPSGF